MVEQASTNDVTQEKVVALFVAQTQDGRDFYCYIQLTVEKLNDFINAKKRGENVNLTTLGEIVARGLGHNPPREVQEKIQTEYGEVVLHS
jgi:hypothetical protein